MGAGEEDAEILSDMNLLMNMLNMLILILSCFVLTSVIPCLSLIGLFFKRRPCKGDVRITAKNKSDALFSLV